MLQNILENINLADYKNIYVSIIVIVIGIIIDRIIENIFSKIIEKNKKNKNIENKHRTYIRLINNILKYIIGIVVIVIVLQVNGIDVTSIIAGLGIVSVVIGLALKDALQDIIQGVNLIFDDYFEVGDVVRIGSTDGKILMIGLKTTRLRDVNNQNELVVSNRSFSQALKLSNQLDIDIPISYDVKLETIEKIINEDIIEEIKVLKNVLSVEYKGLQEFADSSINYKIRIEAKPEFKPQVKRDANRVIKVILDKYNIEIPYTQFDIHNK